MKKDIERLEALIAALGERLAAIENSGADNETHLVAPVRIVDARGRLVADIISEKNDAAFRLYNSHGQAVASLGADGTESGYLTIRNQSGKLVGYLDVERYGARLQLDSNEDDRGGLALFGADATETGGGINIIAAENAAGISLWAQSDSGEIRIEDTQGNERVIDARTVRGGKNGAGH